MAMSDIYQQQVAKARTSYGGGRYAIGGNQQQNLNLPADVTGKSFAELYAQKRVSNAVNNYANKTLNNWINPNTYGGVQPGYSTPGTSVSGSGSTYFAGNAADAPNTSMGGGTNWGNVGAVLAILQGALKVRGRTRNKETGEEVPWDEKSWEDKARSSPGTLGSPFALAALATGGYDADNPYSKFFNKMSESEYNIMKPLYNFFVTGPESMDEPVGGYDMAFSGFDD